MAAVGIKDTIVVGCGAAGIASLTRMHLAGLKVLGLEASSRLGGRINTTTFADGVIEMGAEWVHGEEGNTVHAIANKYNIFEPTNFDFEFFHSNGIPLDEKLGSKLLHLCMNITYSVGDFVSSELQSMADHFSQKYPEKLMNDGLIISPELQQSFLEWYHKQENVIDGCDDWSNISTKGLAQYKVCEGNSVISWGKNGYKTIIDILMKSYPNPECKLDIPILTNKRVKKIIWNKTTSQEPVEIICDDGSSFFCKSSIVTVSLGVLKDMYKDLFHPPLPKEKSNCIEGISIGTVDKIFLHYKNNWWGKPRWFGLLWSEEEKAKIAKEDEWLLGLFCISCPNSHPNVLCAWISGEAARHMETLPHDSVKEKVDLVMKSFFGKSFAIPLADEMLRSSWYSNPLTRGSYSYHSMKCDEHNASTAGLGSPLLNDMGQPIIAFAGEATSEQYFSTVHGAVESGFREADRILEYFKPVSLEKSKWIGQNETMTQVIIIGAGIAGLSAAKTLVDADIKNILVLEAQDRCGGRIYSLKNENGIFEYGAQWLHGSTNKLKQLAESMDLLSEKISVEGQGLFLRENGDEISQQTIQKVDFIVGKILKDCEVFQHYSSEYCDFSIGDYLQQAFLDHLNVENLIDSEKEIWLELLEWHMKFQCIDNSCRDLRLLSAKAWGMYDFDGNDEQSHINFNSTCYSLIDKITGMLPKNIILLGKEVSHIILRVADSTNIQMRRQSGINEHRDSLVEVVSEDGNKYYSNYVICTISLGVLKEAMYDMFIPKLPSRHILTIESMGFAPIGKIFLQFEEKWWGEHLGFQLLWQQKTKQRGWTWTMDISGFDVVSVGAPCTLLGWVAPNGTKVMEKLHLDEIGSECVRLLKAFTGMKICSLKNVYRSKWYSNKSFCGAYSHITRLCDLNNVGPADMAKPILDNSGKPILCFAGEACHDTYFSTTHGAFYSGVEQAQLIIDHQKQVLQTKEEENIAESVCK